MNIDFSTKLKDYDGKVIKLPYVDDDGKQQFRELTLGYVCVNSLGAEEKDGPRIDADEKLKRHKLCLKIHDKASVNITTEEAEKIRKLVATFWTTSIYGRVVELLDPSSMEMPL